METLHFIIPGEPTSKKNHRPIFRAGGRHFIGKSQLLKMREESMFWSLVEQKKRLEFQGIILSRLSVKFLFYMRTRRKCDLSNLYELPQDALVKACIIGDDSQIESHDGSRKFYDHENPRTEIIITEFKQ